MMPTGHDENDLASITYISARVLHSRMHKPVTMPSRYEVTLPEDTGVDPPTAKSGRNSLISDASNDNRQRSYSCASTRVSDARIVDLSGWFLKKPHLIGRSRRRFFVVFRNGLVEYFEDLVQGSPVGLVGSFQLSSTSVIDVKVLQEAPPPLPRSASDCDGSPLGPASSAAIASNGIAEHARRQRSEEVTGHGTAMLSIHADGRTYNLVTEHKEKALLWRSRLLGIAQSLHNQPTGSPPPRQGTASANSTWFNKVLTPDGVQPRTKKGKSPFGNAHFVLRNRGCSSPSGGIHNDELEPPLKRGIRGPLGLPYDPVSGVTKEVVLHAAAAYQHGDGWNVQCPLPVVQSTTVYLQWTLTRVPVVVASKRLLLRMLAHVYPAQGVRATLGTIRRTATELVQTRGMRLSDLEHLMHYKDILASVGRRWQDSEADSTGTTDARNTSGDPTRRRFRKLSGPRRTHGVAGDSSDCDVETSKPPVKNKRGTPLARATLLSAPKQNSQHTSGSSGPMELELTVLGTAKATIAASGDATTESQSDTHSFNSGSYEDEVDTGTDYEGDIESGTSDDDVARPSQKGVVSQSDFVAFFQPRLAPAFRQRFWGDYADGLRAVLQVIARVVEPSFVQLCANISGRTALQMASESDPVTECSPLRRYLQCLGREALQLQIHQRHRPRQPEDDDDDDDEKSADSALAAEIADGNLHGPAAHRARAAREEARKARRNRHPLPPTRFCVDALCEVIECETPQQLFIACKQIEATMNVVHVSNLFASEDADVHPSGRRIVYHVLVKVPSLTYGHLAGSDALTEATERAIAFETSTPFHRDLVRAREMLQTVIPEAVFENPVRMVCEIQLQLRHLAALEAQVGLWYTLMLRADPYALVADNYLYRNM
eukprot:m.17312 g.17312  ORF g.17312 m.17312 type:complete len:886 (+) comp11200_c0_seq1:293-2950(+)